MGDLEQGETTCGKLDRWEKTVCATGTAWGLLKGRSMGVLLAYWMLRHAIYFGLAVWLLLSVEEAIVPFIAFVLVVHIWKAVRIIQADEAEQKRKRLAKEQELNQQTPEL